MFFSDNSDREPLYIFIIPFRYYKCVFLFLDLQRNNKMFVCTNLYCYFISKLLISPQLNCYVFVVLKVFKCQTSTEETKTFYFKEQCLGNNLCFDVFNLIFYNTFQEWCKLLYRKKKQRIPQRSIYYFIILNFNARNIHFWTALCVIVSSSSD